MFIELCDSKTFLATFNLNKLFTKFEYDLYDRKRDLKLSELVQNGQIGKKISPLHGKEMNAPSVPNRTKHILNMVQGMYFIKCVPAMTNYSISPNCLKYRMLSCQIIQEGTISKLLN